MTRGLFDTAAASSRERETASDRERRIAAEREYMARKWEQLYPGTTAAAWLMYFSGSGARPVAFGTPYTRQAERKRAVVYAGVFVPFTEDATHGGEPVVVEHTVFVGAA